MGTIHRESRWKSTGRIRKSPAVVLSLIILLLTGCGAGKDVGEPVSDSEVSVTDTTVIQTEEETLPMNIEALDYAILPNPDIKQNLYWEDEIITAYRPKAGGISYPRLYRLKDGTFLCGFDTTEDGGRGKIKLVRSFDEGRTWEKTSVPVSSDPELDCANAAFFQLENGDVLAAYRANLQKRDGYYSSLRAAVSHDGGQSFQPYALIAEEFASAELNQFGGIYEPLFIEIQGKVAVFYANDCSSAVTAHMEQNIEYRFLDEETKSFGEKHIASDGTVTHSRDGMPGVEIFSDGSYGLVIEATNRHPVNPFILRYKTSPDGLDWSGELQTIYVPYRDKAKAGAPFLIALPDDRMVISFQTDEDSPQIGDAQSMMKIITSYAPGPEADVTQFSEAFVPFPTPAGLYSIWNAMYRADDRLIACTGTNFGTPSVKLRFASIVPHTAIGCDVITNGTFTYRNTQGWYYLQGSKKHYQDFISKKFGTIDKNNHLILINNKSSDLSICQSIPGAEKGIYTLSLRLGGDAQEVLVTLTQGTSSISIPIKPEAADGELTQFTFESVSLESGEVNLSITLQTDKGRTLFVDDVSLVRRE